MTTHHRHYGSMKRALEADARNLDVYQVGAIKAGAKAAWASTQGGRGQGVPRDTGATQHAGRFGRGRPSFRRARSRRRGVSYPARPLGEADVALRGYRLGDRIFISFPHPGGILAYNRPFRSGPRAGQTPSKKVPAGVGFWGLALREEQRAIKIHAQVYRPERAPR